MKPSVRALILAFATLAGSPALAFRNAQFPTELKNQVTLYTRQDGFFDAEAGAARGRPVWIHGGDSLSVGWGSRTTLRERLEKEAPRAPLPPPDSLNDLMLHLPSSDWSWHSGRRLNYGFLNWLQRDTGSEWVVNSTALAGAAYDGDSIDPLGLMIEARGRERARLVTFSLGANDICEGKNPLEVAGRFEARLQTLRDAYPASTTIVPWSVPHVKRIRTAILARLATLPESIAKDRVIAYCTQAWQHHCPVTTTRSEDEVEALRRPIVAALEQRFGRAFDPFVIADEAGLDILDLMSSDCFHPSRDVQGRLADALSAHLKQHYAPLSQ